MKKVLSFIVAGILFSSLGVYALAAQVDSENPSDVEGTKATALNKSVKVSWDAATDDVAVKGYQVHYGTDSVTEDGSSYTNFKDAGNKLTYTVTGLENGTKYYFAVIAYDAAENESVAWSNEASATPSGSGNAPAVDDKEAPQVSDAKAINKMEVRVEFSEEIVLPKEDPQDAFSVEDDDIFEPLAVLDAKMDEEDETNKTVILTTEEQTEGNNYKLTVNIDIKDKAGNPIISGTSDTALFNGSNLEKAVSDTEGPEVVGVEQISNTEIIVNFTETIVLSIDPAENFTIVSSEDGKELQVLGVELGTNSAGVEDAAAIVTTASQETVDYDVVVSGITDEDGNEILEKFGASTFTGLPVGEDVPGPDVVAPADVANFLAKMVMEADKYVVNLSWKLPTEGYEDAVSQKLYQSDDKGENYSETAQLQPDVTNYKVSDLLAGEYWFKLTQKDAAGNESEGVIQKVILAETGPEMLGLLAFSLIGGRIVSRKKKK